MSCVLMFCSQSILQKMPLKACQCISIKLILKLVQIFSIGCTHHFMQGPSTEFCWISRMTMTGILGLPVFFFPSLGFFWIWHEGKAAQTAFISSFFHIFINPKLYSEHMEKLMGYSASARIRRQEFGLQIYGWQIMPFCTWRIMIILFSPRT